MSALEITLERLAKEEGRKRFAYNDATGKTVTCRPGGNLSIGVGVNLETGLDDEEIDFIERHRLGLVLAKLATAWWWAKLDDARASVVLDLGYNVGVESLMHFPKMLAAIGRQDWQAAHDELLDSDAARQLPGRYQVLAQILLTGNH